jgi:hypothetical protein
MNEKVVILQSCGLDDFLANSIVDMAYQMEHKEKMKRVLYEAINSTAFYIQINRMLWCEKFYYEWLAKGSPRGVYMFRDTDYADYHWVKDMQGIINRNGFILIAPYNTVSKHLIRDMRMYGYKGKITKCLDTCRLCGLVECIFEKRLPLFLIKPNIVYKCSFKSKMLFIGDKIINANTDFNEVIRLLCRKITR